MSYVAFGVVMGLPFVLFGVGLIWDQIHRRGDCEVCFRAGVSIRSKRRKQ